MGAWIIDPLSRMHISKIKVKILSPPPLSPIDDLSIQMGSWIWSLFRSLCVSVCACMFMCVCLCERAFDRVDGRTFMWVFYVKISCEMRFWRVKELWEVAISRKASSASSTEDKRQKWKIEKDGFIVRIMSRAWQTYLPLTIHPSSGQFIPSPDDPPWEWCGIDLALCREPHNTVYMY